MTLCTFGVDAGPDNVGMLRRISEDIYDCQFVAFQAVFCMCHQLHLIIKDCLDLMELWQWGPLDEDRRYWPTVATVANVWRSTGTPARLLQAALDEYPEAPEIAAQHFTK
eukprot:5477814-Pyramimonas_sp.AAC.1